MFAASLVVVFGVVTTGSLNLTAALVGGVCLLVIFCATFLIRE
jgi:hypothetical protein